MLFLELSGFMLYVAGYTRVSGGGGGGLGLTDS